MYAVVTPNRNRLASLREVVPSWQAAPLVSEIVVVDFGSETPIEPADFADRRKLKLVRVSGTDEWRIGLALNIGVDQAGAAAICKLDSDIEIKHADWLSGADTGAAFYRGRYDGPVSNGQAVFAKRHWQAVGGYNEWLSGYGFDDSDFYARLRKSGVAERLIDAAFIVERQHPVESRTAEKITTEFFELAPPDPKARLVFNASRNTYLAYLRAWTPELRRSTTVRPLPGGVIGVELGPMSEAQRKAAAFANLLGLVRMAGVREHVELLNAMVARFLAEDGGL
jgi:glycosyltransferase involved in cell wall biosynthesis